MPTIAFGLSSCNWLNSLFLNPLDSLQFEGFFAYNIDAIRNILRPRLQVVVAEKRFREFRRICLAEEGVRFFKIKRQPVGAARLRISISRIKYNPEGLRGMVV